MVNIAHYFIRFLLEESCGKCTPCREGLRQLDKLVEKVCSGKADETTIPQIERVAKAMKLGSLCSLGMDAPNPVMSTLKFFREEWDQHVHDKKCRAGNCRDLITYSINKEKCTGCSLCMKNCPQTAITGTHKDGMTFFIDPAICDKCGICYSVCPDRIMAVEIL
jgi:NAD-dependent dihydropyrimidine dehydrogenase PreA subunit